ncbi:hypothetical protein AB4254_11475 [Vibrio breoganii]
MFDKQTFNHRYIKACFFQLMQNEYSIPTAELDPLWKMLSRHQHLSHEDNSLCWDGCTLFHNDKAICTIHDELVTQACTIIEARGHQWGVEIFQENHCEPVAFTQFRSDWLIRNAPVNASTTQQRTLWLHNSNLKITLKVSCNRRNPITYARALADLIDETL